MENYDRITAEDVRVGDAITRTRTALAYVVTAIDEAPVSRRFHLQGHGNIRPRRTAKLWRLRPIDEVLTDATASETLQVPAIPSVEREPGPECLDDHGDGTCEGRVEYRMPMSGTGRAFPRCEKHLAERLEVQRGIEERYPTLPPSDFDPAYAGESWDER